MRSKIIRIVIGFVVALLLVYTVLALIAQPRPDGDYFAAAPAVMVLSLIHI